MISNEKQREKSGTSDDSFSSTTERLKSIKPKLDRRADTCVNICHRYVPNDGRD